MIEAADEVEAEGQNARQHKGTEASHGLIVRLRPSRRSESDPARYSRAVLRAARLVLAAGLLVVATGCGGAADLPPADEPALARTVEPYLEPLGLQFTYGSLEHTPAGEHLALYVEPVGPTTDEQYLQRLLESAVAVVPAMFGTYSDLHSLDICQEPVPAGPDDPKRPEPRTVLVLSRRMADLVDDWSTATLVDLIVATRTGTGGAVTVDDAIAQLPAYVDAVAEGDRRSPPDEDDGGY